ncbi:hypothetical protein JHW43_004646 [Diplocarpon mali]|nr:hypothetical protein JHW43_004646 [Diplocarpon mali]
MADEVEVDFAAAMNRRGGGISHLCPADLTDFRDRSAVQCTTRHDTARQHSLALLSTVHAVQRSRSVGCPWLWRRLSPSVSAEAMRRLCTSHQREVREAAGQQSNKAARQQGNQAARQQSIKASKQQGSKATRQQAAKQQGNKASRQQGNKAARQQGNKAAKHQGSQAAKQPGCARSAIPDTLVNPSPTPLAAKTRKDIRIAHGQASLVRPEQPWDGSRSHLCRRDQAHSDQADAVQYCEGNASSRSFAAMSALSPPDPYGDKSGGSGYGSGQSDSGKSPLSISLGFLKNLTEKKSARADGQQPKRRGPKPDSKPALTRRQELNRQAQRTHRERKELYIKALEQEVLRLKENFSSVSQDKETLAEENRQLRQLLAQHGIPWTGTGGVDELARNSSFGYTSSGSISGSYAPGSQSYSPLPTNSNFALQNLSSPHGMRDRSTAQQQGPRNIDYDQEGIDFVLTLERPCMDHIQFLVERADDPEGGPTGHALMASCPPEPYPEENPKIPFGHGPAQLGGNAQKTWDLSKPDLANLFDLSKRLNLDGEITPVMAWGMVIGHPRWKEFTAEDFGTICSELGGKVRCYGFGAVLEEFEVRDALESTLYTKPDMK